MRKINASPNRYWVPLVALAALLILVAIPSDADAARRQIFDSTGSGAIRVSSDQGSVTLRLVVPDDDGARGPLRFQDNPGDAGGADLVVKKPRYTIFGVVYPGLWVLSGGWPWP